jgi:predicted membrane channel-forming protein YqfA (hemolysin III family)
MPLVWLVLVILGFFGLSSFAPMFGLDALYPEVFGKTGAVGRGLLIGLMVIGGVFYLVGRARRKHDD